MVTPLGNNCVPATLITGRGELYLVPPAHATRCQRRPTVPTYMHDQHSELVVKNIEEDETSAYTPRPFMTPRGLCFRSQKSGVLYDSVICCAVMLICMRFGRGTEADKTTF